MKFMVIISTLCMGIMAGNAQNTVKHTHSHISASVSEDSSNYSYKGSFDKENTETVKNVITKRLGEKFT